MEYELELAREVKALLLNLTNRAVPYPDYKGGVAFLPGDARTIKRKIIKVNNLLADHVDGHIWPGVVIPGGGKAELCKLLFKLTDGQKSCITHCYGRVKAMIDEFDNLTIVRATEAARKAVEANEQAEKDILSARGMPRPTT